MNASLMNASFMNASVRSMSDSLFAVRAEERLAPSMRSDMSSHFRFSSEDLATFGALEPPGGVDSMLEDLYAFFDIREPEVALIILLPQPHITAGVC